MNKQEQKKMTKALMDLLYISSDNDFEPLVFNVSMLGMNFKLTFTAENLDKDNNNTK